MRAWVVHVSMVLAVCAAACLYARKFAVPGLQDMMMTSLEGAKKYLPKGGAIGYVCRVQPTSSDERELFLQASGFPHFVLAPVSLNQRAWGAVYDTTLIVSKVGEAQVVNDSIRGSAATLWEHQDKQFHYLLIHTQHAP